MGKGLGRPLHHVIGYMALYDRDDGTPRQKTTASDGMQCVSDADNSEHPFLVAIAPVALAPPGEFTNVPTMNGDKPRGRLT